MRHWSGSGRGQRRWFTRATLRLLTQLHTALLGLVLHVHLVSAAHPAHGAPGGHGHDTSHQQAGSLSGHSRTNQLCHAKSYKIIVPSVVWIRRVAQFEMQKGK